MQSLFLFDGNALVHRAYHAYPANLTTSSGQQVNAVYGFARMLLKVWQDWQPTHVAVAFDTGAPTFRHQQFAPYKEGRPEMEQALVDQLPLIRELVEVFNIPQFAIDGYEADDVLATIAIKALAVSPVLMATVVTGDRDLLQLLRDRLFIMMPVNGFSHTVTYDSAMFQEKYGFSPSQLIDYKGLRGDQSDNIPGVAGIGEKTATQLIKKYGSVEKIYHHLAGIPPSICEKLAAGAEVAVLSKKLATIDSHVPLQFDVDACLAHDFDSEKVAGFFKKLEFKSLLSQIPSDQVPDGQESLF